MVINAPRKARVQPVGGDVVWSAKCTSGPRKGKRNPNQKSQTISVKDVGTY